MDVDGEKSIEVNSTNSDGSLGGDDCQASRLGIAKAIKLMVLI